MPFHVLAPEAEVFRCSGVLSWVGWSWPLRHTYVFEFATWHLVLLATPCHAKVRRSWNTGMARSLQSCKLTWVTAVLLQCMIGWPRLLQRLLPRTNWWPIFWAWNQNADWLWEPPTMEQSSLMFQRFWPRMMCQSASRSGCITLASWKTPSWRGQSSLMLWALGCMFGCTWACQLPFF